MTGHVLPGYPLTIENRQAEIDRFYKEVFPEKNVCTMVQKEPAQFFTPDDRLKKALASKTRAEIQKLLDGDFSAYPSQSEADLSLCNHLAFWFNGDEIAIDKTFRESKLYREKWDRKHFGSGETYGQHTINQAVKGCKNFYSALPRIERNISPIGEKAPPVTEKTTDTLTFPDIMSGLAGEFADLYSSYMEAPAHFFYIAFLTCIGSFLNIELASELKTQPRLFVILLGQSADDKKSTAINKTVKFFQDVMTEFRICLGVGSAEGLQKVLKESSHVLLCLDEFRQLISKCKIEGSVLLPFINTLFESNRYEAQTKTVSIYLDDAHLSLLAASTIQTYERTWDASFTDIGFNNRLFIVPGSGEKKHSFPLEIPELERVLLQKKLDDILQFVGSGLKVNITPEARELYHQWYMNLDRSIHAKRLDTYALRFMMLLTVNEMKKDIDEDIVHKVTQLMDWQLQVRRLHDPIDADSAIAKIEEKIRRILLIGAKSEYELKRGVHVDRTGLWPFIQALKNLSTGKEIAWDKANKTYLIVSEK